MRQPADQARIHAFIESLGRESRGPGRVYLTGGACALLIGWRDMTVDVDLKMDPEPAGAFEAIARLKDRLDLNIELASPDQFVPALPGWQERSMFICRSGEVDFHHYDFYGQALAKIERGHDRDIADVEQMVQRELVEPSRLAELFAQVGAELLRYPAIDPDVLRMKVDAWVASESHGK